MKTNEETDDSKEEQIINEMQKNGDCKIEILL